MSEITTDQMAIAPGVLTTIVSLAVKDVPGVASVGLPATTLRSLFSRDDNSGVSVAFDEATHAVDITLSLSVYNGYSMEDIAREVRAAVANAVLSQTGLSVARVDICVEGIAFQEK